MYGPLVCGDALDFHKDGVSLVAGSYRNDDCLEVYDVRMFKRSRVINFDGNQQLYPQISIEDPDDSISEAPYTDVDDEEEKKERDDDENQVNNDGEEEVKGNRRGSTNTATVSGNDSSTTAATKEITSRTTKSKLAPYLYTTMFNSQNNLLLAGGAGRNEFRIFDWDTGDVVAMIDNVPKAILCGAVAGNSDRFVFGSADSRIRMFDWTTRAKLE